MHAQTCFHFTQQNSCAPEAKMHSNASFNSETSVVKVFYI